ncbi:MAG: DUF4160 domain-containing protein [Balneola sp.]
MSPTIFRYKGYRFFFFSREEARIHVHVIHAKGEAKIWLEPKIELNKSVGLNSKQISEILDQVEKHEKEIIKSWNDHFNKT